MSAIPPDIAGAAAQAGFAAPTAARARDADRTRQANVADQQLQARIDKAASVEADDLDTAVFADAEGAGGQGRAFADSAADSGEEPAAGQDPVDGEQANAGHIDIQA